MQVVIDTVSIQHLLRALKSSKSKHNKQYSIDFITSLDKPLQQGKLVIVIDEDHGLVDDWGQTCGIDTIQVLISQWESYGSIKEVTAVKTIGFPHGRRLTQLGFNDTIDRLILRITLAIDDRNVVSDDSDFWDPKQPSQKGNPYACVCSLCREHLGITIMLLSALLNLI